MKVCFDVNIALDVFLRREPFFDCSNEVFTRCISEGYQICFSSLSVTTIYYLMLRAKGHIIALRAIDRLLVFASILPVSEVHIVKAHASEWRDFEDAVQYYSALENGVQMFITRNPKDFEGREIKVVTPEKALKSII